MGEYTVSLSTEEEKALSTELLSVQDWLNHIIHDRARRAIDNNILTHSDKQANKLISSERAQIVRDAEVETAAERNARVEQEG